MANHFSALKRARQTKVRTERNRDGRSRLRHSIRDLRKLIAKDPEQAKTQLPGTVSLIDKMTTKGIIHRNAAGRYKSRLTTRLASRRA